MHNYLNLQKYSDKVFTAHDVKIAAKDKYAIIQQVAIYLDSLIFNLIALPCLIAIINNSSHVTEKTLEAAKQNMSKGCRKTMTGGTGGSLGNPSFVSIDQPMYSAGNPTNDILQIDWESGFVRPQIGGSHSTRSKDLDKIVMKYINEVLKYHEVTASKTIKSTLAATIKMKVDCFMDTIVMHKGTLTHAALKKIIKKMT
jgi:hypothetical protein